MFMASIIMMLSVTLPHHHHDDGLPCYRSLQTEINEHTEHSHTNDKNHDCGCNGHNAVVYASVLSHLTDGDVHQYLMPLLVMFNYIYPPQPQTFTLFSTHRYIAYIDPVKDVWITETLGLRAPPVL